MNEELKEKLFRACRTHTMSDGFALVEETKEQVETMELCAHTWVTDVLRGISYQHLDICCSRERILHNNFGCLWGAQIRINKDIPRGIVRISGQKTIVDIDLYKRPQNLKLVFEFKRK